MALDLSICTQDCVKCIKKYAKDHSLRPGEEFKIKCSGILDLDNSKIIEELAPTPEERTSIKMLLDPVEWARQTLDWHCLDPDGSVWKRKNPAEYWDWVKAHPGEDVLGHSRYHRPYQAEILRCTSKRKVLRLGRQCGKCLPSGTMIHMSDGTLKPIENIHNGDNVLSLDKNYNFVNKPVILSKNGIKPVYKVILTDGRVIEATDNHPFLTRRRIGRETTGTRRAVFLDEWVEVRDLTSKHYVAVPYNTPIQTISKNENISTDQAVILGALLSDGNITSGNCRFTNSNKTILDRLQAAVSSMDCHLKHYKCDKDIDFHIIRNGTSANNIRRWLKEIGLFGLDSHQKFIPDFVMSADDNIIATLLSVMFGCDGWASLSKDGSVEIGYSTVSEKMAYQIVTLLARFGVYATINDKIVTLNGKKYYSKQLSICRKRSIENFVNKIGILGKEEALARVYEASQLKNCSFKTEAYEEGDILFIPVKEVVYTGDKMTWDLTVAETHNFIANGMVTHNTESIVVLILYHLFTKPGVPENEGFDIILITPYQSQIELIFNRALELIRNSPEVSNSIKRNVKAPFYTLELHNNSILKGFSAGTKSGGNAEAVRGQHANMLVFDEADYLTAGDIDAAMSIITNYPNASVFMLSTPTGKREKFYETCHSKLWKHYHFPSTVNPLWNDDVEQLYRSQLTELGYVHEVLAEFGEQEEGVFQEAYIQAARDTYSYENQTYDSDMIYTIGVDWNDTAVGTSIAVLEYNPFTNIFRVVGKERVSKEGWTQLAACQKIADLNRLWKPVAIYLDAGHGGTQYEVLRKYGYDALADKTRGPMHPDSKLRNIVKQYQFGSTIEIRDLFTGQKVKKPAKPFLVENLVRRFESSSIKFPEEDEELLRQLQGYIVARRQINGTPVYGVIDESVGDHFLDAVMLAAVAFTLEETPFGKTVMDSSIAFSGKFGEMRNLEEDGLIIQGQKEKVRDIKESQQPSIGRASHMEDDPSIPKPVLGSNKLPAANTMRDNTSLKIWAWPGFLRDEPPPRINRHRKRACRPKRKKI